jgi:hypothetical protein
MKENSMKGKKITRKRRTRRKNREREKEKKENDIFLLISYNVKPA